MTKISVKITTKFASRHFTRNIVTKVVYVTLVTEINIDDDVLMYAFFILHAQFSLCVLMWSVGVSTRK